MCKTSGVADTPRQHIRRNYANFESLCRNLWFCGNLAPSMAVESSLRIQLTSIVLLKISGVKEEYNIKSNKHIRNNSFIEHLLSNVK